MKARHRAVAWLAALVVAAFTLPVAAFAAEPALIPQTILTEGFEAVSPRVQFLQQYVGTPGQPQPAYWGRVTARKHAGSYGAWCAGTTPAGANTGWSTYGGLYPANTGGAAEFAIPELADYYSASLDFWYMMPSAGANDLNRFYVKWGPSGSQPSMLPSSQPLAAAMRGKTMPLTAAGVSAANLSRTASVLQFWFVDDMTNAFENPSIGEGPSIDDVSVTGWKYGPVRNLNAVVTGTGAASDVKLTWTAPARSTTVGAAPEERPIGYRVFRTLATAPYVWTELTAERQSATSFDDTRPVGGNVLYLVQAWDAGTGEGYGYADVAQGANVFVDKAPESAITVVPATPGPDGTYLVAPIVNVSRAGEGTTYWRWDGGQYFSTASSSFQAVVPSSGATHTLEVYSTNALGTAESPHKTATIVMHTFSLTYEHGAGGTVSGDAAQTVFYGASGTQVTAVPDTGYHFTSWSDGLLTAARTDANVTGDLIVSASFSVNTYQLRYTAGSGGTISGTASQTVSHGGSGTAVTAVPNTGYHFVGWSDGVKTAERTDGPVTGALNVTATFAINTYQLHYSAGAGGTISGTASQTVNYGASGTAVSAVASTGYHFVAWSDGKTSASRTDTGVVASLDVAATFVKDAPTMRSLIYTAGTGGTISGAASQSVEVGGSGTQVTAVPNTGYHFTTWSDGVLTASRTDANVQVDLLVSASFALNTYHLQYGVAAGTGTISGAASQTVAYGGNGTAVTAVPGAGYHFVSWSDGVPTATRTDSNVKGDVSASAAFALNSYQLHYSAGTGGTISGTASQTVSYGASGSLVTAVPADGYRFVSWSDGKTDAARTDANVAGPVDVTAYFELAPTDTQAPVTSWANAVSSGISSVTVSLVATDNGGFGVAGTWYQVDSGGTVTRYAAPFKVTGSGTHTLYYWSVDAAGNREATKTATFKVLKATSLTITSNKTTVYKGKPVTLSGSISSGIAKNAHVYVYAKKPGSSTWTKLSTRHTTSTHKWSYTYYPSTRGTWYFQARYGGNTSYGAVTSSDRRITVK